VRVGHPRPLTLCQQITLLKASETFAGHGEVRMNRRLVWRCEVSPTPVSRTYAIRVEYCLGQAPEVFVEAPDLVALAGGRPLPHIYPPDERQKLCVYLPRSGQWTPSRALTKTILPWTVMWLLYFEDWLGCGVWNGGGMHPDGSRDHYDED
jgi:hypothetical protein